MDPNARLQTGSDFVYPAEIKSFQSRLDAVGLSPVFRQADIEGPTPPIRQVWPREFLIRSDLANPAAQINYQADFNQQGLTPPPAGGSGRSILELRDVRP